MPKGMDVTGWKAEVRCFQQLLEHFQGVTHPSEQRELKGEEADVESPWMKCPNVDVVRKQTGEDLSSKGQRFAVVSDCYWVAIAREISPSNALLNANCVQNLFEWTSNACTFL